MNNNEGYSLRKKEILGVCTDVVKDSDIRNLLLARTGGKCEKVSISKYSPVRSSLNWKYYALISNMVIKATKLICESMHYGEFRDDLSREKGGIYTCERYILGDESTKKVKKFKDKIYEFEKRKDEIKMDKFHLIFEYIDYLTLLEESWRKGYVDNILNYDLQMRDTLIKEVRLICGSVYKDFIHSNASNIRKSFYKNPDFTSEISGFVGDSNFILGNDLYNLKTKHKSVPSDEDVCQSILYYLISRCNRKYYREVKNVYSKDNSIDKIYIYNTRFGDKYEIKLNSLSDAYIENIMEEIYGMYSNVTLIESGLLAY